MSSSSQLFTAFWLGYVPTGPGQGPALSAAPEYVDRVVLAFANLFPGNVTCTSFLQKSVSSDYIRAGIADLRTSNPNTKILMSIGGTPNPPCSWNTGITDPAAFGAWCASVAHDWDLDGFDIDNEDNSSNPGPEFVAAVKGMRAAMPDKILTMDTYIFDRDKEVIKELSSTVNSISTMAYFYDLASMKALVEQYATVMPANRISIGVNAARVGIGQGTSVADTAALSAWSPPEGTKQGMMLWNLSQDIQSNTGEPDGTWTQTIHENMP